MNGRPDRLDELASLVRNVISVQGAPARDEQGKLIQGSKKLPGEYRDYVLSIKYLRDAIDLGDKPDILDASYDFGCATILLLGSVPWRSHKVGQAALVRQGNSDKAAGREKMLIDAIKAEAAALNIAIAISDSFAKKVRSGVRARLLALATAEHRSDLIEWLNKDWPSIAEIKRAARTISHGKKRKR